jgi:hypothetical protein
VSKRRKQQGAARDYIPRKSVIYFFAKYFYVKKKVIKCVKRMREVKNPYYLLLGKLTRRDHL